MSANKNSNLCNLKVLETLTVTDLNWQDAIKGYIEQNAPTNSRFTFMVYIDNGGGDVRFGHVDGTFASVYHYECTFTCAYKENNTDAVGIAKLSMIQGIQFGWSGVPLQSELDALTRNAVGDTQELITATSEIKYTCPYDGYVYLAIETGGKGYVYLCDSTGKVIGAIGTNSTDKSYHDTLFVKRGMQLYVSGYNEGFSATFSALTN